MQDADLARGVGQLSVTVATLCSASILPLPKDLPAGFPHVQSTSVTLAKTKASPEAQHTATACLQPADGAWFWSSPCAEGALDKSEFPSVSQADG